MPWGAPLCSYTDRTGAEVSPQGAQEGLWRTGQEASSCWVRPVSICIWGSFSTGRKGTLELEVRANLLRSHSAQQHHFVGQPMNLTLQSRDSPRTQGDPTPEEG